MGRLKLRGRGAIGGNGINIQNMFKLNYQYVNQLERANRSMADSSTKISTGKRINSAADSPSEIIRMGRLEGQIRGNTQASKNIQDGISLLQTKDTTLGAIQNNGQKLRELSVEYNTDTLSTEDKQAIEVEAKELTKEIAYLMNDTKFNTKKVIDNRDIYIQAGANIEDGINLAGTWLDRIDTVREHQGQVQHTNSVYEVSIEGESETKVDGELHIHSTDNSNHHTIQLTTNGRTHEGSMYVNEHHEGVINIRVNGVNYEGSIYFNDNSKGMDLQEVSGYRITSVDGTKVGQDLQEIEFNLQTETTHHEDVYRDRDRFLGDIEQLNVKDILSTEFVDQHILDPISKERTKVGVQENRLTDRLDFINDTRVLQHQNMSRIEDVDFAKELMNQVKQEMLMNININLFQNNTHQYRQHISQLLQ